MREMKDSGVERIGLIPQSWDIIKTKYVATLYTGNSIKDEEKDNYSDSTDAIPYIATKDIEQGCNSVNYNNGLYVKEIDLTFARAYPESTLMCIEGGSAGRKKAIVDRTVCFVNKLCCFAAKSINPRYLYYCLNSPDYEDEFKQNISGLIGGVSKSTLANFFIPKPSTDDQRIIADYLDSKCSKIDEIIAKQEQIIEKLKEYKISRINEIVVCEDGIKCNLGLISTMKNGLNFSDTSEGSRIRFLGVGDFKDYFFLTDKDQFSTIYIETAIQDDYLLKDGDIIFVRSNGSKELVGRAVMVSNIDYPLTYSGFCIRYRNIRKDLIDDEFLLYYFRSAHFRKLLEKYSQGSNINNMNQELLSGMPFVIPSMNYQKKGVAEIRVLVEKVDTKVSNIRSMIDKLVQYKKSLIYEVVTGKKEV